MSNIYYGEKKYTLLCCIVSLYQFTVHFLNPPRVVSLKLWLGMQILQVFSKSQTLWKPSASGDFIFGTSCPVYLFFIYVFYLLWKCLGTKKWLMPFTFCMQVFFCFFSGGFLGQNKVYWKLMFFAVLKSWNICPTEAKICKFYFGNQPCWLDLCSALISNWEY